LGTDLFRGVFAEWLVTLKREAGNDDDVMYQIEPDEEAKGDHERFLAAFKRYLRYDEVKVLELYAEWSARDKHFAEVSAHIEGVRCVRQDPWECTLSFICSQNNNIKRITALLETVRTEVSAFMRIPLVRLCDL